MKNFIKLSKIVIIAISAVILISASSAQATLIDSFATFQMIDQTGKLGAASSTVTSAGGDIIGGSRYMWLNVTTMPNLWSSAKLYSGGPTYDYLVLDTGSGVVTQSLIRWDNSTLGLGGVDLTDGGTDDRFIMDMIHIDSNITLNMKVTDTSSNIATYSKGSPTPGTIEFLYANFTGGATVDWTNIDIIEFSFPGPNSADMTLDFIETGNGGPVPEPATMLLLGTGLIGLIGASRIKIKNKGNYSGSH